MASEPKQKLTMARHKIIAGEVGRSFSILTQSQFKRNHFWRTQIGNTEGTEWNGTFEILALGGAIVRDAVAPNKDVERLDKLVS